MLALMFQVLGILFVVVGILFCKSRRILDLLMGLTSLCVAGSCATFMPDMDMVQGDELPWLVFAVIMTAISGIFGAFRCVKTLGELWPDLRRHAPRT